jgi:hypothetical protein
MMGKKAIEGIVVKVTEDLIVLLCPNGTFKNVARASHVAPPLLGEHYIHVEKQKSWLKYVSMVAVVFLAILSYAMYPTDNNTYVLAIDINPSIELVLNKEMQINKVTGYNEEGEALLASLHLKGASLAEALEKIVDYSFEAGYLTHSDGFLETAIIPLKKEDHTLVERIEKTITASVPADIGVKVTKNNTGTYDQAKTMKVSVNKFNHLKELENDGVIKTIEEGKGKTVSELRKMQKAQKQPGHPSENKNKADLQKPETKEKPEKKPSNPSENAPKGETKKQEKQEKAEPKNRPVETPGQQNGQQKSEITEPPKKQSNPSVEKRAGNSNNQVRANPSLRNNNVPLRGNQRAK